MLGCGLTLPDEALSHEAVVGIAAARIIFQAWHGAHHRHAHEGFAVRRRCPVGAGVCLIAVAIRLAAFGADAFCGVWFDRAEIIDRVATRT